MSTLWIVALVALVIAVLGVIFFWYQFRRARESFKHIDHSKIRNWDDDGWDDR